MATESFRVAFDDLIDSMEDEAADQRVEQETAARDSRRASQTHRTIAGATTQETAGYATESTPIDPGIPHCGASSTWQQKVVDVEAKLQGDLQQDLARSVLETLSDEKANPSSVWHQCLALTLQSTWRQAISMMLRYLLLSIISVMMTSLIFPPIPVWLAHDSVSASRFGCASSQLVILSIHIRRMVPLASRICNDCSEAATFVYFAWITRASLYPTMVVSIFVIV